MAYAVIDPQRPGEVITMHGAYLRRSEAHYQACLRIPCEVIRVKFRAWLRWRWSEFRGPGGAQS